MERFTVLTGVAAPMLMTNINTDLIAPSLVRGRRPEEMPLLPLKDKMFANLRYDLGGAENPDFVLNQPRYREARILLAGGNFGCGSSRETAVWSLMEYGIACVIASSFGDIFHDNAFHNGLLPIRLEMAEIRRIAAAIDRSNNAEMTVDLVRQVIEVPGLEPIRFAIPEDRRAPLLEGLDQLSVMLQSTPDIVEFERRDAEANAWRYPGGGP
jgi:3-isopropylmalate/(R)-2-methylmalate dehydratase small subunit